MNPNKHPTGSAKLPIAVAIALYTILFTVFNLLLFLRTKGLQFYWQPASKKVEHMQQES